jgi:uncharacterized protein
MDTAPISTAHVLTSLLAVAMLEVAGAAAGNNLGLPRLWLLAAIRTVQGLAVMGLAIIRTGGLGVLGMDRKTLLPGLGKGLVWSAGFALAAALLLGGLFLTGINPLQLIRSPLPAASSQRILFFCVGGFLAPVAEEIVFRGLIFGYLRRWGLPAALLISTALFAAVHLPTLPLTQIIGGIVFALAYEAGGSLIAPIAIHMLGNLAIFTISALA